MNGLARRAARAAPPAPGPSLFIATPAGRGEVSNEYARMLFEIGVEVGRRGTHVLSFYTVLGSALTQLRDMVADAFLESGASHLLALDSDMRIPGEAVFRMLETGRDYISACGTVRRPCGAPPGVTGLAIPFAADAQIDADGCIEVQHAGCAVSVIHRSVFTRISAAGLAPEYTLILPGGPTKLASYFQPLTINGLLLGEDFSFSQRARMAGVRQFFMADVDVWHAGLEVNVATMLREGALRFDGAPPAKQAAE